MAGMINDLIGLLDKQAQTFEELLGLSQEKRDAIVKDELEDLQNITNLENILITQYQRSERKRVQLMGDIAIVLRYQGKNLTLTTLEELMEGQKEQEDVRRVRVRMREALDKLAAANDLNTTLIQNSLEYIDYSLNVLRSSTSQGLATYSVEGGKLKENGSLFDLRN